MPSSFAGALDLGGRPALEDQLADVVGEVEQLGDRGAALEAGAAALDAAGALVEREVGVDRRVEPALHQQLRGWRGARTLQCSQMRAHQALRQHAVERRHEVVGLDLHVEEAAEHVDHVVGVDGGEHQVAGERRLDRDLGGLRVADLAHHDLVGIVAQDRAQPAREGEPLLLVDRDLRDAPELVLDRVLDGDDLVLRGLDLGEAGVERRGLARAGGPGHQHHPVGLADEAAELDQLLVVEAQHVEPQALELCSSTPCRGCG